MNIIKQLYNLLEHSLIIFTASKVLNVLSLHKPNTCASERNTSNILMIKKFELN